MTLKLKQDYKTIHIPIDPSTYDVTRNHFHEVLYAHVTLHTVIHYRSALFPAVVRWNLREIAGSEVGVVFSSISFSTRTSSKTGIVSSQLEIGWT